MIEVVFLGVLIVIAVRLLPWLLGLFSRPSPPPFRARYADLLRDLAGRGINLGSLAYLGKERIARFVRVRDQMQASLGPARWAELIRALNRQDPRVLRFLDSFRCDQHGRVQASAD
jgi:hypothetical protein